MGRQIREKSIEHSAIGFWTSSGDTSLSGSCWSKVSWIATAHSVAFPKHWKQLIEYLQVRLSEPCGRGNVISMDVPVFWRTMSRWFSLQSWATLWFDDHRGITPTEVSVSSSGLNGRLTRTKVSGPDKRHNFRLLVVHSSSYVHQKDWLVTGWRLLEKEASHLRDYLLFAPTNNFRGFKREELSYQTAFAVHSQMISLASYREMRISRMNTGHYYTPHSGRNFMPSATSVLNFARSDRDMLGGWSSEGSERYSRAATYKIELMQQGASKTFKSAD